MLQCYKNSFLEAAQQVQGTRASNPFSATMLENQLDINRLRDDLLFQDFLDKMEREALRETTTEDGRVPNTTLWLIGRANDDVEVFIGRVLERSVILPSGERELLHWLPL